ncbi:hypothetical protein N7451_009408 [Penicillium sp. IBT 35674x]|nr:hypothetical protein N7451_009408 [Penicillium sp. IBT 35674x]
MEETRESILLHPVQTHRTETSSQDGRTLFDDPSNEIGPPAENVASQAGQNRNPANPIQTLMPPQARLLKNSWYILYLVLGYVGLALFSWVVICILSVRPITAKHYGVWIWNDQNNGYGWTGPSYFHSLFVRNERWYRAAQIIQSIVTVFTIPLTSAVCSSAAVIYIQRRKGLSLLQMMTLADKGWNDLRTYGRTFPYFATDAWKRYGSFFLLLAMFVNILGAVIAPLQAVFLSSTITKTPTWPSEVLYILDIPDQFRYLSDDDYDDDFVVVMTRSALTSATKTQQQAQLWQSGKVSCAFTAGVEELPISCEYGGAKFEDLADLSDPFLAQLPSGYNTGLIRQFAPRINSSAQYENISAEAFPKDCDQIDGAFFIDYTNTTYEDYTWGVQACMPTNVTSSPWKSTRDRQDFTEELYLNITLINYEYIQYGSDGDQVNSMFFKVTLNTTGGYFELPNYMNGGSAGSLLDKDPNSLCGNDCEIQGFENNIYDHDDESKRKRRDLTISEDDSLPLETVQNKGPLLTIALALFGDGSFIQTRQAYPQTFAALETNTSVSGFYPQYTDTCKDLAPLDLLISDMDCIVTDAGGANASDLNEVVAKWINNFNDPDTMKPVFNAAAFLANQAWMNNNLDQGFMTLTVSFDMGADTKIPVISRAGVILISTLLGLDIFILLSLATYAWWSPRWTRYMDSWAMMRIGASLTEDAPLLVSREEDKVKALEGIPGWIGNKSEEHEQVGTLALGGSRTLISKRGQLFNGFDVDKEQRLYNERVDAQAYFAWRHAQNMSAAQEP